MSKLFKKMPQSERKAVRIEVRMSSKDADTIRTSAHIRNLCVGDFIRRAALGYRADVKYETEIILYLREVVQSIRRLHATYADQGIQIPKDEFGFLIDKALSAMQRISR